MSNKPNYIPKNPYCDVFVQTTRPGFRLDDVVDGSVILVVREQVFIESVLLKFKGSEHIRIFGIKADVKVKDCEGTFEMRKNFAKRKFPVVSYNCLVQPGTYVFPFKMSVDPARPASLTTPSIKTEYKLKAQVIGPDFVTIPVTHTIPIEFFLAVPMPIVPSQVYKDVMVNTCCCYSAMNLKCTAITDKNAYAPGENITLTLLTDASKFTKDIKVSVAMIQNVITNKNPKNPTQPFALQSAMMPLIPAGKKVQNSIMLPVPTSINPSNLGGIYLKWHYCISVTLNVTCAGSVELRVPFTIYGQPNLAPIPPISLPPGSNPQVHETTVLDPSKAIYPY